MSSNAYLPFKITMRSRNNVHSKKAKSSENNIVGSYSGANTSSKSKADVSLFNECIDGNFLNNKCKYIFESVRFGETYNELLTISCEGKGLVLACQVYKDNGKGFQTKSECVNYPIVAATGNFKSLFTQDKMIQINFNNDPNTCMLRTLKILPNNNISVCDSKSSQSSMDNSNSEKPKPKPNHKSKPKSKPKSKSMATNTRQNLKFFWYNC